MTREEAKEILTHNWTRVDNPNYSESELDEAFFMAIESLSEPRGDLISRADAIEAVMAEGRKVYTSEYANAERIIYEADAVEALAMLPLAEAVHGWITDRNPTENGTYIVTIADEDGGFVCELHYGEPLLPICKVNGSCWYDSDDEFGDCPYYDIIAWMPLPEPYKGGGTE